MIAQPEGDGPASFQVELLPARVAYLIRAGSESGFRRAVQEASSRWGGMKEPIIRVYKNKRIEPWLVQIVEIAGVDAIVNVDITKFEADQVSVQLNLPLVNLSDIDSIRYPSCFTSNPASLRKPGLAPYILPKANADLWQIVAAGDLTPKVEKSLLDAKYPIQRSESPDFIARSALSKSTMLDATITDFNENWALNNSGEYPAIMWITKPNSLVDCLWFWNLRVLAPLRFSPSPMFILPANDVSFWIDFPKALSSTFMRADEFSPDVILNSHSIKDLKELHKFASMLGLEESKEKLQSGHKFPAISRPTPYTYKLNIDMRHFLVFPRQYGAQSSFDSYIANGTVNLNFESPIHFTGPGFTKLRIHTNLFDALPKLQSLAEIIFQNATWDQKGISLNVNAQNSYKVQIHIPTLSEATINVLRSSTSEFSISDKGKIANVMLALGATSSLLTPGAYKTIKLLETPRSNELLKQLKKSRRNGASDTDLVELALEWGGRSERRSVGIEALPKSAKLLPIEVLCASGWAERGFQIKCIRCLMKSFIPLATVASQPACPACGSHESFLFSEKGLRIFYRLNALIDRASDQGVIPHILAVESLMNRDQYTYIIPGLNVTTSNGQSNELDLYGIHSGRIVAGEVKTSPSEFTRLQIQRDTIKSKSIGAEIHIMATMFELTNEQIAFAEKTTKKEGIELLILSSTELNPK